MNRHLTTIEVAPGREICTTEEDGIVPGPALRFREGKQGTVDVMQWRPVAGGTTAWVYNAVAWRDK